MHALVPRETVGAATEEEVKDALAPLHEAIALDPRCYLARAELAAGTGGFVRIVGIERARADQYAGLLAFPRDPCLLSRRGFLEKNLAQASEGPAGSSGSGCARVLRPGHRVRCGLLESSHGARLCAHAPRRLGAGARDFPRGVRGPRAGRRLNVRYPNPLWILGRARIFSGTSAEGSRRSTRRSGEAPTWATPSRPRQGPLPARRARGRTRRLRPLGGETARRGREGAFRARPRAHPRARRPGRDRRPGVRPPIDAGPDTPSTWRPERAASRSDPPVGGDGSVESRSLKELLHGPRRQGRRHRRPLGRARQPRAVPAHPLHARRDRRGGEARLRGGRLRGPHPRAHRRRRSDLRAETFAASRRRSASGAR